MPQRVGRLQGPPRRVAKNAGFVARRLLSTVSQLLSTFLNWRAAFAVVRPDHRVGAPVERSNPQLRGRCSKDAGQNDLAGLK